MSSDPRHQPFLHELVTVLSAPMVALCGRDGQVREAGVQGVYAFDRRLLSAVVVTVDGVEPECLRHKGLVGAGTARSTYVVRGLGDRMPDPTVLLHRTRQVAPHEVTETLRVESRARGAVSLSLGVRLAADLADLDAVKQGEPAAPVAPSADAAGVHWSARRVHGAVTAVPAAAVGTDGTGADLRWAVSRARRLVRGDPDGPGARRRHPVAVRRRRRRPVAAGGRAGRRQPRRAVGRPRPGRPGGAPADRATAPDDVFLAAAGAPGSSRSSAATRCGRPGCCCRSAPTWPPAPCARSPACQGTGRRRPPPSSRARSCTSCAATSMRPPVRLSPAAALLRHGRRDPAVGLPAARRLALGHAGRRGRARCCRTSSAALAWMRDYGDADGDGFLEYVDETGHGLANQGWKDSGDAVQWRDGRSPRARSRCARCRPTPTRRPCTGRDLLDAFGRPGGDAWRDVGGGAARPVPRRVLGARRRRRATRRSRSTRDEAAGRQRHQQHRAPARHRAARRRTRSAAWSAAWLVSTMFTASASAPCPPTRRGYWPLSYHGGAVWTHDTAIAIARAAASRATRGRRVAVAGAARRGPRVRLPAARAVRRGARPTRSRPVPYPASCRPQAWSAAAGTCVATLALGLRPDVPNGTLTLSPPADRPWGQLVVDGLRLGGHPLRVTVDRDGTATAQTQHPGVRVLTPERAGAVG